MATPGVCIISESWQLEQRAAVASIAAAGFKIRVTKIIPVSARLLSMRLSAEAQSFSSGRVLKTFFDAQPAEGTYELNSEMCQVFLSGFLKPCIGHAGPDCIFSGSVGCFHFRQRYTQ